MGAGIHGGFENTAGAISKKSGDISTGNSKNGSYKISESDQSKHIPGSKNYQKGKSIFKGNVNDAQKLINDYKGKGERISDSKERVDFGKVIGKYVDNSGKEYDTTIGIIHTSKKKGSHIVPARPKKGER